MKTTVDLRDDIYAYITTQFGKRSLSKTINELLAANLFGKKEKSMFGSAKWLQKVSWNDVREERDHDF